MVTMLHYDGMLEPVGADSSADKKSQHVTYLKDHAHEDIDADSLAKVRTDYTVLGTWKYNLSTTVQMYNIVRVIFTTSWGSIQCNLLKSILFSTAMKLFKFLGSKMSWSTSNVLIAAFTNSIWDQYLGHAVIVNPSC
jgi:hypothetical protein